MRSVCAKIMQIFQVLNSNSHLKSFNCHKFFIGGFFAKRSVIDDYLWASFCDEEAMIAATNLIK